MPLLMRMILACAFSLGAVQPLAAGDLQVARDLALEGREAGRSGQPLVLFFTRADCAFCARARAAYLNPLAEREARDGKAMVREVAVESPVGGFDGKPGRGGDAARALGVRMFPTVLVVNGRGVPLAEPLVGFGVPDLYGAMLDQRIESTRNGMTR